MRQTNNKRMRSRSRKNSNPLSRSYESNGPDVKVRGTASHVAEKYVSLARDAQSSGDRIMYENYLQHAEHYLRIIAAAQANVQPPVTRDTEQPSDQGLDAATTNHEVSHGDGTETSAEDEASDAVAASRKAEADQDNGQGQEKKRGRQPRKRTSYLRQASNPNRAGGDANSKVTDKKISSEETPHPVANKVEQAPEFVEEIPAK